MCFNNRRISKYIHGIILLFILVSCGQKNDSSVKTKTHQVVIEIILDNDSLKDSVINLFKESPMELYEWKNHLVLFGFANDTVGISMLMSKTGVVSKIKKYNNPFYVFDKSLHCGYTYAAKPWKNYILTANLVNDTAKQQEYLTYHKTQFEVWPEVAQGFCNADFQQLLVYKTGRQLMLVISIPSDKTLDELNPKTIENNPRVIEWNSIMSKYQKGIEGTQPHETWVFFNKIEDKSREF